MQKETVLITGGAGYIGSHAVKLFLEQGYRVIVFDNLSRGYKQAVETLQSLVQNPDDCLFIPGDLRKKEDITKAFEGQKVTGVLHFAALCSVDESMHKPELYFENNVLGTLNLVEAMRTNNVKKIIFSSTCAVYGESQYLPVDEKHPTNPANPYGETKLGAEKIISWYGKIYNFDYFILRYFNVCGADDAGVIGDSKKPSLLLMQNAVRGALGIEAFSYTCGKVETKDGTPIRDYIDVEDLVEAHYNAFRILNDISNPVLKKNLVLNLGNGAGYSVKEIVSKVEEVFGKQMAVSQAEPRKGEYAAVYADITKAKEVLGFQPKKSLEQSILSLKKWYEKFPQGYAK